MQYGFCTYFASENDRIHNDLLERIARAGYDYVELPLFLIEALSEYEFSQLKDSLKTLSLQSPLCTNLFPDDMIITGPKANHTAIDAYLDRALPRASQLGVKQIIFANIPAWQAPYGNRDRGYRNIASLVTNILIPRLERYGLTILIEPLRRSVCDLINTLADGMALVEMIDSPHVGLMADMYHMINNRENMREIYVHSHAIEHVHIAENMRALPVAKFSQEVATALAYLKSAGYDGTISYETRDENQDGNLEQALFLLKSFMNS
jgi:D-psicose/D-tagatose/L-ribulose 3-epimerase